MVAINEFLWFQDVVNHFRPMKMRKQIGKTYRVTLHTHPTPKYLEGGNASKSNTHWYQHISLIPLLMVMVSPLYSWEWSILAGLKWCSHSICGEYLWFRDVVNHFRPMKMRKQIGKTYRVTLHTHPTPKYLEGGNASKSNTHWYQHISLIPLLMVMVSPLYSWEWSILMGRKWCSHSICGEYLRFQDQANHFRPMKTRKR